MKKLFLLPVVLFIALCANAQQVGVGQWRDHLPYNKGLSVAAANNRVYVVAETGVFYYDLADNSVTRLSKVSGLSDIGANVVRYHNGLKTVVIGYNNGNMDLIIDGKTIENYSDIKRSTTVLGKKTINNIMFIGDKAYIATNFGICIFNLTNKEFEETYIIGPNGSNINVNQTTTDGTFIYAATDIGLFKANLNNAFLNDFNNWTLDTGLPNGTDKRINAVLYVHNKLYANYSNLNLSTDTCFVFNGTNWVDRSPDFHYRTYTLTAHNDRLIVTCFLGAYVYNASGTLTTQCTVLNDPTLNPNEATFDDLGNFWLADKNHGAYVSGGNISEQRVTPTGPQQKTTLNMVYNKGNLWAVPGGNSNYTNSFNFGQVSKYDGSQWMNRTKDTDTVLFNSWDYMNVAVDPNDPNHAYFTSWGKGLVELKDNVFTRYMAANSNGTILPWPVDPTRTFTAGVAFEDDGRLWFTNAFNQSGIIQRATNGTFTAFDFGTILSNNKVTGPITIDSYGQKWVVLAKGSGILVFKDSNGTIPLNRRKVLSTSAGNGALSDADVRVVVEDLENQMWVGTAKGVCVFYSPEAVFSGSNFDAQKPGIVEGGFFYPLLENEKITCMVVDGANRKWIGTEKGEYSLFRLMVANRYITLILITVRYCLIQYLVLP
ncbi:MAG: hypothetical protein M0D57_17070 [Sphingobacteriales bacterium JAD_PAG50586_3]|nr:MAG: hypothetical protein M0D57_17070 [Sphingobacteriales bacterium JAD_PAG50586_3]